MGASIRSIIATNTQAVTDFPFMTWLALLTSKNRPLLAHQSGLLDLPVHAGEVSVIYLRSTAAL